MVFSFRLRYIRAICISIATILLLLFCVYQVNVATKICILDPRFGISAQEKLRKDLLAHAGNSAHTLLIAAHDSIAAVKELSVRKLGSLKTKIIVQALDPRYRVTDIKSGQKFVLTQSKLVSEEQYLPILLDFLPTIDLCVQNENFDEQSFIATFINLPEYIFDTYNLLYKNKTEIQLISKKQKLTIIADHETISATEKIAYAEFLAEKKYSKWVTIDIRFAHGAVCTPKGEVRYENRKNR